MIKFNPKKLVTKLMYVKMVSGALGGTLTVVDAKRSKKEGKEVFTRLKIPHQLARHWSKKYRGMNKYMKPVLTAVTFYEDHVVCLERHPLGNLGKEKTEGLFGMVEWKGQTAENIEKKVKPLAETGTWYIDGTFMFTVTDEDLKKAEPLSANQMFRQVKVNALKLSTLGDDTARLEERVCLAYYASNGDMSLTPPIWKTLQNIGQRQISSKGASNGRNLEVDDDEMNDGVRYISTEAQKTQFDEIDEKLCVNLGFALKAGKELSDVFGYDSIEPLGLDDLMIQLRTVNLPNIAHEVKQTFDIGLKFTIACAWLIGMTRRTNTLDSYIVLRSLLKYLTTKGVYRKGAFSEESIFKTGSDLSSIKMMSRSEALQNAQSLSIDAFLRAQRLARQAEGDDTSILIGDGRTTAQIAADIEAREAAELAA
jgi:hypothetical protein